MRVWRKEDGKCRVRRRVQEKQKNFVILELFNFSELYGQEVSYYGEGLIVTGEAMNQLGDMR